MTDGRLFPIIYTLNTAIGCGHEPHHTRQTGAQESEGWFLGGGRGPRRKKPAMPLPRRIPRAARFRLIHHKLKLNASLTLPCHCRSTSEAIEPLSSEFPLPQTSGLICLDADRANVRQGLVELGRKRYNAAERAEQPWNPVLPPRCLASVRSLILIQPRELFP